MAHGNRNKNSLLSIVTIFVVLLSGVYMYFTHLSQKETQHKNRVKLYSNLLHDYSKYETCMTQKKRILKDQCSSYLLAFGIRADLANIYFKVDADTARKIAIVNSKTENSISGKDIKGINILVLAKQVLTALRKQIKG